MKRHRPGAIVGHPLTQTPQEIPPHNEQQEGDGDKTFILLAIFVGVCLNTTCLTKTILYTNYNTV